MAKKNQQAKTLSEAFLKVREHLWNGRGAFESVFPNQEQMICFAAIRAKNLGKISKDHYKKITEVVQTRLDPHTSIRSYLNDHYPNDLKNHRSIQDYRHAWLIHLAQEFEGKDETI